VPVQAAVGDVIQLHGYDLLPAPGGPILRTYWEPTQSPLDPLDFFVRLINPAGERLAQWDGAPLEGLVPTAVWQTGRLYIDRRTLRLPDNLQPGAYTIQVGLYDPASGVRRSFTPTVDGNESGDGSTIPDALVIPFVVPE
jgi:hypothetical protein